MSCALCNWVRDPRGLGAGGRSVYEDDVATVLVDSAPARRAQAWVIPKAHTRGLAELDARTGQHLLKLGRRAALSLGLSPGEDLEVSLDDDTAHDEPHVHVVVRRTRLTASND
jgi:diadenosine tetraphosphate (Ap4A) HIT family hydrolase